MHRALMSLIALVGLIALGVVSLKPNLHGQNLDVPGTNVIWFMNGHTVTSSVATHFYPDLADWDIVAACDLDGDSVDDYVWWNHVTGQVVPWLMNADGSLRDGSTLTATIEPEWKLRGCSSARTGVPARLLWRYTETH
jgi:hypothetical protein